MSNNPNNKKNTVYVQSESPNDKKKIAVIFIILALIIIAAVAIGMQMLPGNSLKEKIGDIFSNSETTTKPISTEPAYTGFVETDALTGKSHNATIDKSTYTTVTLDADSIFKGDLILVNRKHAYNFEKNDTKLISLFKNKSSHCGLRSIEMMIDSRVAEPLKQLIDDFYIESGLGTINITSAYRSSETQETLLNNKIESVGEENAKKLLALPGYSEHHTGLAVDFQIFQNGKSYDYDGTEEYEWINKNCYKYGFIVRYNDAKSSFTGITDEPWHFRYVGIPHAQIIYKRNICLEEYIEYLKDFTFGTSHLVLSCDGVDYEIYYTSDTVVPVPADKEYTISGNNSDGFIVAAVK